MGCETLATQNDLALLRSEIDSKLAALDSNYATKRDVDQLDVKLGLVNTELGRQTGIVSFIYGAFFLLKAFFDNVLLPAGDFIADRGAKLYEELRKQKEEQDKLNNRWYLEQYEFEAIKGAIFSLQKTVGEHTTQINSFTGSQQKQDTDIHNLLNGYTLLSEKASDQELLINSTRYDVKQLGDFTNAFSLTTQDRLNKAESNIDNLNLLTDYLGRENARQNAKDNELEQAILASATIFTEGYKQLLLSNEHIIRDLAREQDVNQIQTRDINGLFQYSVNKNNEQDNRLTVLEGLPRAQPVPATTPQVDIFNAGDDLGVRVSVGNQSSEDRLNFSQIIYQYFQTFQNTMQNFDTSELKRMLEDSKLREEVTMQNVYAIAGITGLIATQTSPIALRQAAAGGSCDALNGGCGQNFRNQIREDGANNLIPVNTALQGIDLGLLQRTFDLCTSIKNDLIDKFDKTWEWLGGDRIMNIVATAATLHNAAMLSRDLSATLDATIGGMLSTVGVNGPDGQPLSLFRWIGGSATTLANRLLGTKVVNNASKVWRDANRMISTVSSAVMSLQSVGFAIGQGVETVGSYVAQIGNGLEETGIVPEREWPWQNPTVHINALTGINKFNDGLQTASEITDQIYNIVSQGQEIASSVTQLRDSLGQVKTEATQTLNDINTLREENNQASASPDTTNQDLIRIEADEVQ